MLNYQLLYISYVDELYIYNYLMMVTAMILYNNEPVDSEYPSTQWEYHRETMKHGAVSLNVSLVVMSLE